MFVMHTRYTGLLTNIHFEITTTATTIRRLPLSRHLVTVGRKTSLLTRRNFSHIRAQGAICRTPLCQQSCLVLSSTIQVISKLDKSVFWYDKKWGFMSAFVAPVPMQNTDQPSENGCSGAFSHRWMYTCYSGLMKVVCDLHPQLKLKRVCLLFSKHLHHEVRSTAWIRMWSVFNTLHQCDCNAVAPPGLLPAEGWFGGPKQDPESSA